MRRRLSDSFGIGPSASLLARGSLVSFLVQGFGAGLIFVSEVFLARIMGAGGYGLYATVMAWLQVLVIVVLLGSNNLLLRLVPTYVAAGQLVLLQGLIRYSTRNSILIGSGIFACAVSVFTFFDDYFQSETRWAFLIAMTTLPIAAMSLQRQAILRGLHRIAAALSPELIVRPVFLTLIAGITSLLFGMPLSAPQALSANGAAVMFAFLLGWYLQRRAMPPITPNADIGRERRTWMRIGVPLFLVAIMQLFIVRMDIMLLGILEGRESAGIYAASSRISDLVVFALGAANLVVAPMIAALYARNDIEALQRMLSILIKGTLLITMPIAIWVVVFGDVVLGLFGDSYNASYLPLQILVIGQLVNASCGPVAFILAMTGYQMALVRILGVSTLLSLALNLVLIPIYGIVGAALSTAITTAFWNVSMLRSVRRHVGVESSALVLLRSRS